MFIIHGREKRLITRRVVTNHKITFTSLGVENTVASANSYGIIILKCHSWRIFIRRRIRINSHVMAITHLDDYSDDCCSSRKLHPRE
jgi:hypothetical protein